MASAEELTEYIKPILKEMGFKKKQLRWIRSGEIFTCSFLIQKSTCAGGYYVRPGVYITKLNRFKDNYYGDIWIEIPTADPSGNSKEPGQILDEALEFFKKWTDPSYFKEQVLFFNEWDKRNPIEKRRANEVDYEKDPVPRELFVLSVKSREYAVKNF